MAKINKTKVFVDMDGVIANFAKGLATLINHDINHHDSLFGKRLKVMIDIMGLNIDEVDGDMIESILFKKDNQIDLSDKEKAIKKYTFLPIVNNRDFWEDLEMVEGTAFFISELQAMVGEENVYILSSPVDEQSVEGKKNWINKNLPSFRSENIFIDGDKGKYPGLFPEYKCVLFDDRIKYTNTFEENGGIGVLNKFPAKKLGLLKCREAFIERMKDDFFPKDFSREAAGILFYNRNAPREVLLIRQSEDGSIIGIPCGKREIGENPFNAAAREVLEETGITVYSNDLLRYSDYFIYTHSNGFKVYTFLYEISDESLEYFRNYTANEEEGFAFFGDYQLHTQHEKNRYRNYFNVIENMYDTLWG